MLDELSIYVQISPLTYARSLLGKCMFLYFQCRFTLEIRKYLGFDRFAGQTSVPLYIGIRKHEFANLGVDSDIRESP